VDSSSIATLSNLTTWANLATSQGSALWFDKGAYVSLANAVVASERGPASAIAGAGIAVLSHVSVERPDPTLRVAVAYTGTQMTMDYSRVDLMGGDAGAQAMTSTSKVRLRNSVITCPAGGTSCLGSAALVTCADVTAGGTAYGFVCSADAECRTVGVGGIACVCPPTWLGDPLVEECHLPPGLLYTIPASLKLVATKPGRVSGIFTFLNGGSVPLRYYINQTGASEARSRNESVVRAQSYRWHPATSVLQKSLVQQCSYDLINISVASVGLPARSGYNLTYLVVSNSISGNAPLTVDYAIFASADPATSPLVLPSATEMIPVAGTAYSIKIILYDDEGLPISNSYGTEDVAVTMRLINSTAAVSCDVRLSQDPGQKHYLATCNLLELQGGPAVATATMEGVAVVGSPATLSVLCPPGFVLAAVGSVCVCPAGSYYGALETGKGSACKPCGVRDVQGSARHQQHRRWLHALPAGETLAPRRETRTAWQHRTRRLTANTVCMSFGDDVRS
jgi:hypothetical protein